MIICITKLIKLNRDIKIVVILDCFFFSLFLQPQQFFDTTQKRASGARVPPARPAKHVRFSQRNKDIKDRNVWRLYLDTAELGIFSPV